MYGNRQDSKPCDENRIRCRVLLPVDYRLEGAGKIDRTNSQAEWNREGYVSTFLSINLRGIDVKRPRGDGLITEVVSLTQPKA